MTRCSLIGRYEAEKCKRFNLFAWLCVEAKRKWRILSISQVEAKQLRATYVSPSRYPSNPVILVHNMNA